MQKRRSLLAEMLLLNECTQNILAAGLSWAELRQKQSDTKVVRREKFQYPRVRSDLSLSGLRVNVGGFIFILHRISQERHPAVYLSNWLFSSALSRAVQFLFAPFQVKNKNQPIH